MTLKEYVDRMNPVDKEVAIGLMEVLIEYAEKGIYGTPVGPMNKAQAHYERRQREYWKYVRGAYQYAARVLAGEVGRPRKAEGWPDNMAK